MRRNIAILRTTQVVAVLLVGTIFTVFFLRVVFSQDLAKARVAERFKQYDKNGDGKVSAAEYDRPDLFKLMDRDGDGFVTLDEAEAFFLRRPVAKEGGAKDDMKVAAPKKDDKAKDADAPPVPTSVKVVRKGPKILKPSEHGVGRLAADVSFTDLAGKTLKLSDLKDSKAIVVALTSTSCPLSRKFFPSLVALEKSYIDKGVAFVYANPIGTDSRDEMKEFVKSLDVRGSYVSDGEGTLARAVGATSTTDVVVLDGARTVLYHGAVDDQYGYGYALESPRHRYLAKALDAIVAGKRIEIAATEAPGCALGNDDGESSPAGAVTYHNRISRIVQDNCLECHRAGGVGPFSLATRDELVAHQGMIKQVVDQGVMPPWFAASNPTDHAAVFRNDRSLSAADRKDLLAWFAHGLPTGDEKDAPQPRRFESTWNIGIPDAVVQLPKPVAIQATGVMPYQNIIVPTNFDEDKWVQALEVQPTDRAVVHHVLVFIQHKAGSDEEHVGETADERRGFFASYVPGNSYVYYPDGFAKRLPKGATLRFQLHYTPTGKATQDQTKLGMVFAKEPPKHEIRVTGIIDAQLSIPPGESNHEEGSTLRVPAEITLLGMMPHMHVRGKAFRYEIQTRGGEYQTVLDIPRYDFNWQLGYRFNEPPTLPAGTSIKVTGWYDNSKDNPANPDSTKTVKWGPQTYDEMLIGYIEYYHPNLRPGDPVPKSAQFGGMQGVFGRDPNFAFQFLDTDKSGKLSREELGKLIEQIPQLQDNIQVMDRLIPFLDTDKDGEISREEFQKIKELRKR